VLNLYIGYDAKEAAAFAVLSHSILRRATAPISITPLVRDHFRPFFTRERGPLESTDFSISRFLVPYLSGYQGYSLFMDCDMLCQTDITQIWHEVNPSNPGMGVWVAQHDYLPKDCKKMDGQIQTTYDRKNWSSFVLFNNSECRALTPDYVNTATGLQLHRFQWLKDEKIGALPLDWNWLVGEYEDKPDAKILHYTLGGPWFPDYRRAPHARLWLEEFRHLTGQGYYADQVWEQPETLATSERHGPPARMRPWPEKPT
jgi:hypothetical protein